MCTVLVAAKAYHTSSSAVPVHPRSDWVAEAVVPKVGTQFTFGTKEIALAQLSFANSPVIFISST